MAEQLTISVIKSDGTPYPETGVSVEQSDVSGTTDEKGNVTLDLPVGLQKVVLVIQHGNSSVKVPFYVTEGGSRLLTVDFEYLQAHENDSVDGSTGTKQAGTPTVVLTSVPPALIAGVIIAVVAIVVFYVFGRKAIRKYLKKRADKKKAKSSIEELGVYW